MHNPVCGRKITLQSTHTTVTADQFKLNLKHAGEVKVWMHQKINVL